MILDFFLDLLFPRLCVVCKTQMPNAVGEDKELGNVVCDTCFGNIELHNSLFCGTCGARLPENKKICHKDAPYILGAATEYREANGVPSVVHALKFRYIEEAAIPLATLTARYVKNVNCVTPGMAILPIPLSRRRERERGFNQSLLIAKEVGHILQLPVVSNSLTRVRHSNPQSAAANKEERQNNVINAFTVTRAEDVGGRDIILIDDVTTSGATFREAARTLKASGARKIIALAVAKA